MKEDRDKVSLAVVRRIPKYYRYLEGLSAAGVTKISSKELGAAMGLTASQIRQDLNCFGGFGQQGYGYNVDSLKSEIGRILGLDNEYSCIIVGAGRLGSALAASDNLSRRGFRLIGVFDADPSLAGRPVGRQVVRHADELAAFCAANRPDMAVIAVPPAAATGLVSRLAAAGVRGFWNFAGHIEATLPGVVIEDMHLEDAMMTLSYRMKVPESAE